MRLMKKSGAFLFWFVLVFAVAASSQTPQQRHQQIVEAVERRDYPAAISELEKIRRDDGALFEINNYDYLAGRLYERTGNFAKAASFYHEVARRGSALREYALLRLAAVARTNGNLMLERLYLKQLLVVAPDSLAADSVRIRHARSVFESGDFNQAIAEFSALGGSSSGTGTNSTPPEKTPRFRENLVYLGESQLRAGNADAARRTFTTLISNLPNPAQPDDFALAGAKGLDRLDAGEDFGKSAPRLTDLNHLQRASIYHFNRDFHDARLHFQAIVTNHPASALVADALFQIGRGYAQEQNFGEAIKWFERVLKEFPESPSAKDAVLQSASAHGRLAKFAEAIERYQKFIDKYPDAENLDRAYLNIIDAYRDAGNDVEALGWSAKTQEKFRGKTAEAQALFSQLRIRVARGEWQNAIADADKLLTYSDLGGTRVPGGTNRAEVTFMKAVALENLGRFSESADVYLSIPEGRAEYFGWRSSERLRALAAAENSAPAISAKIAALSSGTDDASADSRKNALHGLLRFETEIEKRRILLEKLRAVYAVLPDYQKVPVFNMLVYGRREVRTSKPASNGDRHREIADELLFLGLFDEAVPELEKSLGAAATAPDAKFTLATLFRKGDIGHRAVGFIEPLWRNIPADFEIEMMPKEQARLLYPAPYADDLARHATPRGVDPRFVLSIMRQESRYRPDVKSNAAARGLMQFISTTSNKIALELGRRDFRQDELFHPPTAVLFGSQYLANLYKLFPNGDPAVAAAYNGGEDNVARWIQRAKSSDADRYVPEIVFSQSKDYAYKVSANFRMYRLLYDENLRPR